MTKPSDFSPSEALEVRDKDDARQSGWAGWVLRAVGVIIFLFGWLMVSLHDFGDKMFFVSAAVFATMALYASIAGVVSRRNAVNQEKKLRLRLLVHNMELENMSTRDELTQLFNRRYLMERLERELQTAKGFQRPLAFIAIEVTSLNHINHTYGYAVGDRLLAAFGRFLLDYTRATDIPARMSGNKFGIILPDTSRRGAYAMIERLTQALVATPLMDNAGRASAIVASFGTSGYPWGGKTVDAIVREAEIEIASKQSAPGDDDDGLGDDRGSSLRIPAVFRESDGPRDGS